MTAFPRASGDAELLHPGQRLDGYRIEQRIGPPEAHFHRYRAHRAADRNRVVLDVFARELGRDRDFEDRLRDRFRALARVDHPSVVVPIEVGRSHGRPFLVWPELEAPTLEEELAGGQLTTSAALDALVAVAGGLDAMHQAGVVHGVLRPSHILLCTGPGGRPRPLIAGIRLGPTPQVDPSAPNEHDSYLAPELDQGAPTPASDVYAFARLLYEALTHARPDDPAVEGDPPRPAVPLGVRKLLRRSSAEDPAARHPSAGRLMREVREAMQSAAFHPDPADATALRGSAALPVPTPRRGPRLRPALVAGITVALVALVVAGFLAGRGGRAAPAPQPQPTAPGEVASGPFTLTPLESWVPVADAPDIPGLLLDDRIALAPRGFEGQVGLLAGDAGEVRPNLLPAGLAPLIGRNVRPDLLRLGSIEAYRFDNLSVPNFDARLTVYAVPSSAGVATMACYADESAAALFLSECERIVGSIRFPEAEPYPLRPDPRWAGRLDETLAELDATRRRERERLRNARTRAGQVETAGRLADAYGRAARALPGDGLTPLTRRANDAIVAALREARSAYRRLAAAARRGDAAAFSSAREDVRRAESRVQTALGGLDDLGYRVSGP